MGQTFVWHLIPSTFVGAQRAMENMMLPIDDANAISAKVYGFNLEAHDFFKRIPDLRPREVAIMGGAFLEYGLKHLLESKLPEYIEKIFREGPLHTMEARAKMARALGCIPKQILTELLFLGQIRNQFAHEYSSNDFSKSNIIKVVKTLDLISIEAAIECFRPFFGGCYDEKFEQEGFENPFFVSDEFGFVLISLDISQITLPQDLYVNSLKFSWAAILLATVRRPL